MPLEDGAELRSESPYREAGSVSSGHLRARLIINRRSESPIIHERPLQAVTDLVRLSQNMT